ncbi:MAG: hypothetical protein QM744_15430 [Mesorhizobium sp.]
MAMTDLDMPPVRPSRAAQRPSAIQRLTVGLWAGNRRAARHSGAVRIRHDGQSALYQRQ